MTYYNNIMVLIQKCTHIPTLELIKISDTAQRLVDLTGNN